MNDVARVAGVSLKTVSRVVNGERTVSPELALRVQDAVATLNYQPDIGASTLRRADRRTGTIGLLLEDVGNPFSAILHRAVEDQARERDIQVLTGSLNEDPERERKLVRALAMRRTDGLIIAPASDDHTYLDSELSGSTPMVFVDRPPSGIDVDSVLATNSIGATDAVRHLITHGHRDIAYLGDYRNIATARSRYEGYRAALTEAGLPVRPNWVLPDLHDVAAAEGAVMKLFSATSPPTALFSSQNLVTIGAVRGLRRLSRQHDVALIGFDDFPLADMIDPGVTVIAQDPAAMGRTAAQVLFRLIDGDRRPADSIWLPTTLIPRGSGEIRP